MKPINPFTANLPKKAAKKTLTKAERDENLKKFLELSVVKERMFHGSTNPDIVQFKTGKTLLEERYPQIKVKPFEHSQGRDAAFLTPDPQFASRYSGEDWYVGPGTAPTIYPVRVQAQNPWDYDNPEHIEAAIKLYKEKFPLVRDSSGAVPSHESKRHHYFEETMRQLPLREKDNWTGIERPEMQEVIRDLGHDSFYVKEQGIKNLGIYDPKKIKSDLGNQGTYDVTDPDITKAAGGAIKKAARALTAAERKANLDKFLEPSAVQMRLYHGTGATEGGKGQEAIRQFKPSKEGALGSGTYLTPQPNFANTYAETPGGYTLPVYAQIKNPLILRQKSPDRYKDPMIEALELLGMDSEKAAKMVERAYETKGYIGKEVESRAKAAGYDGLLDYDRHGNLSEVVSYNPSAIKSALGNEGTYDTSTPLLNKAEGGLIRMQGGGNLPPGVKRATDRAKESKSVLPVAGARQARQAIQGYLGMDPSFSVMDPEAQALESAYRGGETASVLGDLVASLTPFAAASAAAKANQVPGLAQLIAYHGSPHKFKKFDASKIGTGEGAQAYGHGLYFAENPDVAKTYQPRSPQYEQKLLKKYNAAEARRDYTTMEILEDAMMHRSPEEILQRYTNISEGYTPAHAKAAKDFASWYAKNLPEVGGMYRVDIPDEKIAQMLDWDKPLSQQPKAVQEFAKSKDPNLASKEPHFLAPSGEIFHWTELLENVDQLKDKKMREMSPKIFGGGEWVDYGDYLLSKTTGGDFYRSLSAPSEWSKQASIGAGRTGFDDVETSALLREAGIPGIQYLDQASRHAKQGTRNFVVFPGEEQNIKMLDIDGVPQKAAGGAIRMQDGGDPTQMFNFNPMAAKAAKQKQMRESTPETPLGAFGRGFATGLFGSTEEQVPYTGSIMEGSPQRQQSQANLREIGRNVGALTDIGGMVTPFVKPAAQAVTRGATALGRAGLEQVDRAMFGEGPLGNALSMAAPLNVNAPVSRLGFYDPVEEAGLNLKRKQGPGQAFLNELQRAENVNKQFLEQSGIAERLRMAPNITREEVQAMTKGAVPEVKEVVLGSNVVPPSVTEFAKVHLPDFNPSNKDSIAKLIQVADQRYQKAMADGDLDIAEFAEQAETEAKKLASQYESGSKPADRLSKYAEYQLPGGKNYREVLLTVPVQEPKAQFYARKQADGAYEVIEKNGQAPILIDLPDYETAQREIANMFGTGKLQSESVFRGQHWQDPNVVSHIRMNDRTDFNGKKVLFIEEMQSDWAQQGRKKGFGQEVPEGPFVKNTNEWVDLSLKSILKRAVDEGYDRVAFINGKQSADRYDLANYVDNIHWDSNPQSIMPKGAEKIAALFMKDYGIIELPISSKGIIVSAKDRQFNGKRLDEVVGRDVANKIMAGESGSLGGQGLSIGGEGMKKFYDQIVPDRLRKLVGKDNVKHISGAVRDDVPQPLIEYNARRDQYEVFDARSGNSMDWFDTFSDAEDFVAKIESIPVPPQLGFDITPEIREKFSQPIPYKHGGVVKMAAGGAKKLKRASEAIAKFQDPQATKIQEWQWRPLAEVNKQLKLAEVPDYIQRGYGDFMIEQGKRARAGNLGVRDLIKAYGITQSSIGRGGLSYDTATKAGLKVPKTEGLVRPEGAFAEWLGSKQGQKFLDDAERGVVNEKALDDIRAKFAPFGKANQLTEQLRYGVNNVSTLVPQMQQALVGSADEYRDWAESIKGIAGAKSGFIGSMLGRGDLPTLDARQLNLHSLDSPVAPQTMMQRGKGLGAREAVDRLAARQSVLGLDIDPSLDPYYQHLAHHAVWDKVADEKTTHEDLMRALRGYKEGGEPDTDAMRLEMMRKSWRSK